jgi:RsiW-degrading membrane proteinase PrsW (M82 family)
MNRDSTHSTVESGRVVLATVGILFIAGIIQLIAENGSAARETGAAAFAVLTVWAVYSIVVVRFVYGFQKFGRRPAVYAAAALAWGVVAGAIAQQVNTAVTIVIESVNDSIDTSWTTVPITEEVLKLLGVVALATVPLAWLRGTLDGLHYGVLVGVGFLIVENVAYTVGSIDDNTSVAFSIFGMLIIRGVIGGLLGHALYSGLIGAGIGYFIAHRHRHGWRAVAVLAASVLGAIATHAVHNTSGGLTVVTLAVSLVPLVLLVVVLRRARANEQQRLIELTQAGFAEPLVHAADVTGDVPTDDLDARLRYVHTLEMYGADNPSTVRAASPLSGEPASPAQPV